jgi:hypothetical protein
MAIPNHRRRNEGKIEKVTFSVYFEKSDYEILKKAIILSNEPNRVAFVEKAVMEKCTVIMKTMNKKTKKR